MGLKNCAATQENMDEPQKHDTNWKNQDTKCHIWFYLYETSRISTFIDTEKIDYVFQKLEGVGNGVWLLIDLEFSFGGGVIKLFWN